MASDGWREAYLEDLADEITVGHVGPMASEYIPEGIPFLRSQNVEPLRINISDLKFISEAFHARLRKSALAPGDVVIVRTGKPGACAVIPDSLPVANCSDLVIVRCGPELDARFLSYYVNSAATHHIGSHLVGAVQQHFNVGSARRILLLLPPVTEQRAIARVLGMLDDKIELNRRMNETCDAMARSLFKSWFVDFEPVRAKAEGLDPGLFKPLADLFPDKFEQTELGEIPTQWEVSGLDKIGRFLNGLALQKYPATGEFALPVIKIAQLRTGNTEGADKANTDLPPDYIVYDGDVLFSWSGSLECVLWTGGRGALNQHLFKVTSPKYPKWFYYLWIHRHLEEFRSIAASKATTMGHIQRHHLSGAKVVLPPSELISKAGEYIAPLIDAIVSNDLQSRTLQRIRDTSLPKLISGEVPIEDRSRFIGGVT